MPRAIALDHEIMRVFQQLGVVDAIEPLRASRSRRRSTSASTAS